MPGLNENQRDILVEIDSAFPEPPVSERNIVETIDQDYPDLPTLRGWEGIRDSATDRGLRKIFVIWTLVIFSVFAILSFIVLFLFGTGCLSNLPPETIHWIFGTMLADIVGATVFGWKAAASYLFQKKSDP